MLEILALEVNHQIRMKSFTRWLSSSVSDSFKLIRIPLERQPDVKRFLKHILESCNLSTEKVEKIKFKKVSTSSKFNNDRNVYSRPDGSVYEEYEVYAQSVHRAKQDRTLKWVNNQLIPIKHFQWKINIKYCDIIENGLTQTRKQLMNALNHYKRFEKM